MKKREPIQGDKNIKDWIPLILNWYDSHGRILPWRENKEPYRVWVSEIMLQQTRVEAVKPYFERFMESVPNVETLASLDEKSLLKLWEGLGYYSRAYNLKKTAKEIVEKFSGKVPGTYQDLIHLPGIGEYTAGAILSISFEQPIPAVDGNVMRIFSRLWEIDREESETQSKKKVIKWLENNYPKERCGDFTQSLMELGAMICVPNGKPKCEQCPISSVCMAFQNQTQNDFPVKKQKKERKIQEKTILFLRYQDKFAVERQIDKGVLQGLWKFPSEEGILSKEEVNFWVQEKGFSFSRIEKGESKKHIFTHIEWQMISYVIFCEEEAVVYDWVTREQLEREIPLPIAYKKFLKGGKF